MSKLTALEHLTATARAAMEYARTLVADLAEAANRDIAAARTAASEAKTAADAAKKKSDSAESANKLTVPHTINGAAFDGTENVNTKYSYNASILYSDSLKNKIFFSADYTGNGAGYLSLLISGIGDLGQYHAPAAAILNLHKASGQNLIRAEITYLNIPFRVPKFLTKYSDNKLLIGIEDNNYYSSGFVTRLTDFYNFRNTQIGDIEVVDSFSEEWQEVPVRKLLGSDGGAVNGLIENYGGIGITFSNHANSNPVYRNIARVSANHLGDTAMASCIISSPGNYGSPIGGVWLAEFGNRRGAFSAVMDCIHKDNTKGVSFGYHQENGYYYLAISVTAYAGMMSVTQLHSDMIGGGGTKVEFLPSNISESQPTGWTEIPQRVLQDAEQVRAIVQEELAKRNL